jgi:hypothetical protein
MKLALTKRFCFLRIGKKAKKFPFSPDGNGILLLFSFKSKRYSVQQETKSPENDQGFRF